MGLLRIATFVNDDAQYAAMRRSFEAAGFVEPDVAYSVEHGEPFAAITRLGAATEPHVLLVHQDVRADRGQGLEQLTRVLAELTQRDPSWAVAGNAGVDVAGRIVRHLADRYGDDRAEDLPRRVQTLDENLLVLRTDRRPRCSPSLEGFHLYGADVCLNARRDGSSCYVVDFRVSHLGDGGMDGFSHSVERFGARWAADRLWPYYVPTTVSHVPVARASLVRRVMRHPRTIRILTKGGAV